MDVLLVVEDILQEVVLRKLLHVYRKDINIVTVSGKCGNMYIKENIRTFNAASQSLPHIIMTDLDRKFCAPQLIKDWINFDIHKNMFFRIAEKEIDAWLLSDREAFARLMNIPINKIPMNTQEIAEPKQYIINLARKSRKKNIKDIVPDGMGKQGPGYNIILQKFVYEQWDAERAANNNESLRKTIDRLKIFMIKGDLQ
jgi:hypothetical protein